MTLTGLMVHSSCYTTALSVECDSFAFLNVLDRVDVL